MLKSMTGFGRASKIVDGREVTVEIKSVNHRYFEFYAKVPRVYGFLDDKMKSFISEYVKRGKVELYISVVNTLRGDSDVAVNLPLAKKYKDALDKLSTELSIENDMTISMLSRFSDIFVITKSEDDEDEILSAVKTVAAEAVVKYNEMRSREGEKLFDDLLLRIENIEKCLAEIEKIAPQRIQNYRTKLYDKIREVVADCDIDENRVLTEVALLSEKIAVDEETVRLASHIEQFKAFINSDEPIGRKMDFLVQELNREANTIGSKANDINISTQVVEIKSDIEKIREQIQNIE